MDDGLGGSTIEEVSPRSARTFDGLRLRNGLEPAPQTTAHLDLIKSKAQVVSCLSPRAMHQRG